VGVVAEVAEPLDPDSFDESDGTGPFALTEGDRLVDRMDEHATIELDEDDDEGAEPLRGAYPGSR
jgi:hypothetical protein